MIKRIKFIVFTILAMLTLNSCRYQNKADASYIFSNSLNYVVELKSTSSLNTTYGTAVILNNDGVLVSNAHMVTYTKGGEKYLYDNFYIRYATSEDYQEIYLFKYDENIDLAFLKIDTKNVNGIAEIGNSDQIKVGDTCYAIGNALNHGISFTKGNISLKNIEIEYNGSTKNMIQSDLTINEGNSGGALLDENGKLIGIVTFRLKDSMGNVIYGLAFSIPINFILNELTNKILV